MRGVRDSHEIDSHVRALHDSFDDNIETSISFFREEIEKLTQDDELTLMEIIEQASRKKHAQDASKKERRASASRQNHRPTPPLAPRNSRLPTVRAASRSSQFQRVAAPPDTLPPNSSDDSDTGAVMEEVANKFHHYEEEHRRAFATISDDSKPRRILKEPRANEGFPGEESRRFPTTSESNGDYATHRMVDLNQLDGVKRIAERRNPSPEKRRMHDSSDRSTRSDPQGQVSARGSLQPHVNFGGQQRIQQPSHYKEKSVQPTEYGHVKPRAIDRVPSEPQGAYAKRVLSTPATAKDKQPLSPTDNLSHDNKSGADPPNNERMEKFAQQKRMNGFITDESCLPKTSSSEVEAWRSMVQLLQETLDRQKDQVQKLEKENEELRTDNRKLRQEMSSMLETMDRSIDPRHGRPPIPVVLRRSDASIDQYSLDHVDRRFLERNEQNDDWSLPGPATVSESRSTPSYLDPARRSTRPHRTRPAFSPPVPELDRVEGIPQQKEMGEGYRQPVYDQRNSLAEHRYFTPVPKYAFNPGTHIVGNTDRMMHYPQDYHVPRPYMGDDYYGRREGPGTRESMYR